MQLQTNNSCAANKIFIKVFGPNSCFFFVHYIYIYSADMDSLLMCT